jgi:hypothetical protein
MVGQVLHPELKYRFLEDGRRKVVLVVALLRHLYLQLV